MTSYRSQLIQLYAKHDVQSLDHSQLAAQIGKSIEELLKDPVFVNEHSMIAGLKTSIEAAPGMVTSDPRQQVVASLKLLHNASLMWPETGLHFEYKLDLLRDLLIARHDARVQWTLGQKVHFGFIYANVKNWKSYFISYGNSLPRHVNDRYKEVIDHFVDEPVLKTRDRNRDNILPDAIIVCLRHSNLLKYFYDRVNIQPGDVLRSGFVAAAMSAFSLIQLIQHDTFVSRSPNWPHEEYENFEKYNAKLIALRAHYRKLMEKRFCALLTEEGLKPPKLLPLHYTGWADRVFKQTRHEILPTEPQAFHDTVDKVADAMIDLQLGLIESVPA